MHDPKMKRRRSMCETCPFRTADETYRREAAALPAPNWPCHDELDFHGESDIQCRGHHEARRKFSK
jgi:hypothetical protein